MYSGQCSRCRCARSASASQRAVAASARCSTPPAACRPARPRAPAPPPRARRRVAPAAPRSRPARCGSRGSSPGVVAAQVLDRCRPPASGRGRRSGTAALRLGAERVGDEALGRQLRPVQVAARHAAPPMYSSPATPTGTGWRWRVQHVEPQVGDRHADRAAGPLRDRPPRTAAGRSTCTVVSVMPYMLTSCGSCSSLRSYQGASVRELQRLAAEDHVAQRDGPARCALRGDQLRNALGVWLSTVTPLRSTAAR